ncbi:hypothetical protein AB0I68_06130 [Streptomyces sp. NPDC050448]|uniref:hypothetical protein n=1 Tax=Streptomyces sp. NPDC050448 TaxID=3155404 RepID=UPI003424E95C
MALNAKWQAVFGEDGRGPGAGSGPRMTLASAGPSSGGSGGGPDLQASQGPWTSAGNIAGALRTSSATAVTELATANEGVSGATGGFSSTAALTEILGTWTTRLTAVRDECGRLNGSLKTAGRDFGERDIAVRQTFSEAVVGQSKNRG